MKRRCLGCMEQYDDRFKVCPHCGYVVGTSAEEAIQMQPGTLLHDRYIVGRVIGSGGFGVTYLGWDGRLEQKVAIKEYLPGEFSTRMPGSSLVTVFNGDKGEQFHDGMKKLIEESKRLSKFQNEPGIVKIFDSFEENCTAYIVMEYLEGMTLASYLEHVGTIPEDEAVSMLMPVMASLQTVHEAGLLHRDIAPDNIFLTRTGEVKLIDFGAARYATTTHSRSLTVIIKPGYSPEEQYRSNGNQGPHTDVHALAATLYKMITGVRPADAMDRYSECETKGRDLLVPLHKLDKNISKNRENAILNGLNVRIEDRTADIESFIGELNSDKPVKRRYGKIKKIDIYSWPLWLKILIPVAVAAIIVFGILVGTGVIPLGENYKSEREANRLGWIRVPNVVGMQSDVGEEELVSVGFCVTIKEGLESDVVPAGEICVQTPNTGYKPKDTMIYCRESLGNGEVIEGEIPVVIGRNKEDAEAKLVEAGYIPKFVEEESNRERGTVCRLQEGFEQGKEVPTGTEIIVYISKGISVDIPNLVGKTQDDAVTLLREAGLEYKEKVETDPDVKETKVYDQAPGSGEKGIKGETVVTIYIKTPEETKKIPSDILDMNKDEAVAELRKFFDNVNPNLSAYSTDYEKGCVMDIDPPVNTEARKSQEIVLMISKGPRPVNVVLDENGGKIDGSNRKSVYDGYLFASSDFPKCNGKEGYKFVGWSYKKDGKLIEENSKIIFTTVDNDEGEVTLYAQWTPKEYDVILHYNDGTNRTKKITVTYNKKYGNELLEAPYERDGYGFGGYYKTKECKEKDKVEYNHTFTSTEEQHLYAKWDPNALTVEYVDADTGALLSTESLKVGEKYNLPTKEKTGHRIAEYFIKESGAPVTTSSTVKMSSDHTVCVKYEPKTIKITFDAGDGNIESGSSSISVKYGSTYETLPVADKDYHNFEWWQTESGTPVEYDDKMLFTENTTLYAYYTKNEPSGWTTYSSKYADTSKYIIEDKRWVYDYTQTASGTEAQKSGWETQGWKWNGTWIDGYKKGDDYKTQQVISGYETKTVYNYYRYSVNKIGGYGDKKETASFPNKYTYPCDTPLTDTYKASDGSTAYKYWYNNKQNYFVVYKSDPFETKENVKAIYKDQYQYKIYTYKKVEKDKITTSSDPTGKSGVSNVRYQIMYIEK